MTSNRPYLLRALYEWILDNNMTPHLLVDTAQENVRVPPQYIENNRIILNIVPDAVRDLVLGNESITFSARFGGKSFDIHVPISAVLAIYARENGKGLIFPADEPEEKDQEPLQSNKIRSDKPTLKVIK